MFVQVPYKAESRFWKFSRPFHGPYRVTAVTDTGLQVVPVDDGSRTRVTRSCQTLAGLDFTRKRPSQINPREDNRGQRRTTRTVFDSVIVRALGRSSVLKRGKCNGIGNLIKEVLVLCCVTARTVAAVERVA